jgi:hypothetical protein
MGDGGAGMLPTDALKGLNGVLAPHTQPANYPGAGREY